MTLDEAIMENDELAENFERRAECYKEITLKHCRKSKQLASWLRELKERREADTQTVKHGKWQENDEVLTWEGTFAFNTCSECQFALCDDICQINGSDSINIRKLFKYCPNCGAKMDGGDDDENS